MMPSFKPKPAFDLELEGSIGTFRVGDAAPSGKRSTEVMFIETHVGFDPQVDSNDKLLKHLAPVREVFPPHLLGFDEIMQRDIDDARVSTELIPYLLDTRSRGSVKFFPPIVIVVLPVKDQTSLPGERYPTVTRREENHPEHKTPFNFIRSGAVGMEAFEFEFPMYEGRPRRHDYARLKLNTSKVRMVIVDGQHRAMALLALYRNMKNDWGDERRMAFRDYYTEWTKARIDNFNLNDLHLPIIVCTFPEIDTEYAGELTLIEASRRMFLTLNESARKVSKSRNLLLDDQDLVSHFMRETLRTIKARDLHAVSSLRIWNVELDQYGDKQTIDSPIACTGVTHCYYMIEHILFDDGDVKGISARSGKFSARKSERTTENLLERLDGENLLGAAVAGNLRRDDYTKESADKLAASFMERYGTLLVAAFDSFAPFAIHCKAALEISESLKGNKNPKIRTILFEGQNINRTFESYLAHMQRTATLAKRNSKPIPPEIQTTIAELEGTSKAVEDIVGEFKRSRLNGYFATFGDRGKLRDGESYSVNIQRPIDRLYDDVYFTVAFQSALVCGFFQVMELAEREAATKSATVNPRTAAFAEYIKAINAFFVPTSMGKLKNLLRLFFYDVKEDRAADWKPVKTGEAFGEVVFRGEMKPDEWPKYRIVFLELWEPSDPIIKEARDAELDLCRKQAFRSLHSKKLSDYCVEHRKSERELEAADWDEVFKRTYDAFDGFLSHLVPTAAKRLSQPNAKKALKKEEAVAATEPDAEEDTITTPPEAAGDNSTPT